MFFKNQPLLLPGFIAALSLSLARGVLSSPTPEVSATRIIFQFPNGTGRLENIAVRQNGNLLLDVISAPEVRQLNPFNPTEALLVHSFPGVQGMFGIVEFEPDVFAVIGGNFSLDTITTVPHSYSLWKVDMRPFKSDENGNIESPAAVTKIASIPEGLLLNGATILEPGSPYVLLADSGAGTVFRVNVHTGEYKVVLSDETMTTGPGLAIGINGIHIFDSVLYYTNTNRKLFAKVPINLSGPDAGTATGAYEIVANNGYGDDFTFDAEGNAYVATNLDFSIQKITLPGNFSTIAGGADSVALEGDSAAKFGRTAKDRNILYVCTSGGLAGTVADTYRTGGKVVAIDVSRL
ncbi:hypothetical protein G7Y89_g14172 [Cudoniella acicularis]|uniref:SMP-30/Gluconolactonase/LRE-like region domain-containing protein n=1 Tax=Cudoniella acicularis TaxID=354080 RepID=A0A8H4R7W7_9HELO|nr:hypothetical protein G7Y89_g14172 [Cudoniella acicularis]